MKKLLCRVGIMCMCVCVCFDASGSDAAPLPDAYADKLLGNMDGLRDRLDANGVTLSVDYMARVWHVADGGIKTGSNYVDNFDVRFDIDNAQLLGITGNRAAIHITHNAGGSPNQDRIGSAIGIDNVEVPKGGFIIYELWDEQTFAEGKWSVRAGISELNNEFMYTESGLNFLSPVQQLSQTLAQSDGNGPSSFPYTEPGVRLKYMPSDTSYIMAAGYNGSAGDTANINGTRIRIDGNFLLIAEAGITPSATHDAEYHPNKLALGAWTYTDKFNDLIRVDASGRAQQRRSYGAYALSSWQLFNDSNGQQATVFFRPSMADGNTSQVAYAYEMACKQPVSCQRAPTGKLDLHGHSFLTQPHICNHSALRVLM